METEKTLTDNLDTNESLLDFIRRKGGKITPRALVTSRKYQTSREALEALEALVASGKGKLTTQECGPNGGRRRVDFLLNSQHNPTALEVSTTPDTLEPVVDDDEEWTGFNDEEETPW